MTLERLVKGLHVPPFLVDCDDAFCVTLEVAASQIQNPGATVFVCKDLADEENRKVQSSQVGECQKVWGSAGFVRIDGHMIHRRPTDTAVAIGCLYRDRREGYRHGGRQAVRKRQQCPPRTVDRAGHPRPRHALPDCPTLFGTLLNRPARTRPCQRLTAILTNGGP